ncbi:hypothetical protein Val02_26070 [Virgisporangium aliadipatigenens]|uniref:Lipoprotein n=1 Tax=Virgisporangium aliadipatigenens TaxID=741659 RepID=A0A8J3YIJ4_9ACTN|nr:hypothetical protein [Virgisporangium aliadipatigenens]GIJ45721.1 hypothetical protein Val02_26070 [Virgisporangium aliadipatigenens]
MRALPFVAALAVAAAALAACSDDRPPLKQPAAEKFKEGPCREAADPILALGRFTYDREGAKRLKDADYPFLVANGEKLIVVKEKAQPEVGDRIGNVLTNIGYLRIRPGKLYDPALLKGLESARADLQNACVG